jgi:hypothetical protein
MMPKKKRTLTPEEVEWEATRDERTRYIYGRLNRRWAELTAEQEAPALKGDVRRRVRRLIPFRWVGWR